MIRTGALPEDGVIARPLGKLTMVNCASPHYLTRFGYPQSPDDLTSHAIVRYTPHPGVHPLGFEVASVNGVQWFKSGGMLTVNSSENYLTAGLAGLGIIQIPRIAVREALRAGRLIEVLRLPCRAALPFAGLSAASGAFPACKPVYAVAGWRNERVPGLTDYTF